ncbi:PREDICTED: E3 ubiquitin-protein ligase TRIM21-like [Elephantulus edwardii]|uniref:E3 ubiquitin-protein ligase TRIM21-like n=1 Tax=Elephantulus edwardii TaxID=28737 RepID=UPI0003F0848B|nr:PREDICTED: E3 ubiquitin-protein ligase TRIM21-like [Elephantulus edwardii]
MASNMPQERMWEEVKCPICSKPMVESVSTECEHSFCKECIIPQVGRDGDSACPVCQATLILQPNVELSSKVNNLIQQVQSSEEGPQGHHCGIHGEQLHLFCKEHGKLFHLMCEECLKHLAHRMDSIDEEAQEYQEKLQVVLRKLIEEQELIENLEINVAEKRAEWKSKVEMRKSRIHMEFKQQITFLAEEEQRQLQKLEEEERAQLRILGETETQLSQQSQSLQELISQVERRSWDSALDMLQEVKSILERSETWGMKKLDIVCPDPRTKCSVPGLKTMLRTFGVHIKLDPDTANPCLILSEDLRQVRFGDTHQKLPDNDKIFDFYPIVLGAESFSSGKHYWEVDVTGKKAWDLGVCRDSVQRKGQFLLYPENGFWTIWLWKEQTYDAGTSFKTSLHLEVPPCQVGIFLDCDSGTVSFYNVTDHGSLIYTFSECAFGGPLRPFFNPGFNDDEGNTAPLILCH